VRTGVVSAREAVRRATERLERAGVSEPEASASVLLSELLGVGRAELALHPRPLTEDQAALYEAWISRRLEREPVQRILGYAYFRHLILELNEEALIPGPDTESVVDLALERIDVRDAPGRVLDIGTGSGAIAISIATERPSCEVHAADISERALEVARRNAERNEARVTFHRADIASGLESLEESVHLLIANPPYVEGGEIPKLPPEVRDWEPCTAVEGGADGLHYFRRIFAETPPLLGDGSEVVLEVGDGQADAVLALGGDAGFTPLGSRPDLAGTPRAVLLRWER
jgi:release factor glutamine methyltransferase